MPHRVYPPLPRAGGAPDPASVRHMATTLPWEHLGGRPSHTALSMQLSRGPAVVGQLTLGLILVRWSAAGPGRQSIIRRTGPYEPDQAWRETPGRIAEPAEAPSGSTLITQIAAQRSLPRLKRHSARCVERGAVRTESRNCPSGFSTRPHHQLEYPVAASRVQRSSIISHQCPVLGLGWCRFFCRRLCHAMGCLPRRTSLKHGCWRLSTAPRWHATPPESWNGGDFAGNGEARRRARNQ
jgi:hypothetical protein